MTFEEIQEALKNKDILFSDIAEACEVTRPHVSLIAKGNSTSHKVAQAICLALDMPINQVFGTKYDNPGRKTGKHRVDRKKEIIEKLRQGLPVPPNKATA